MALEESGLSLRSYGATHIGRRREVNQDAYQSDDELGLWVVADGMGGHAAGEIASQESVDTIFGNVRHGKPKLHHSQGTPEQRMRAARRLLEGAVQAATYLVFAMSEFDAGKSGMGTTISAMMEFEGSVVLAQVGDSRIYRVRGDSVEQLTEDHTLIAWQLKQGLITEADARVSRQRNVITRAVGSREYVQVDTQVAELQLGDTFLLCSDGLHGYLNLSDIRAVTSLGGELASKSFIDLANERGGKDNITALLVEVS